MGSKEMLGRFRNSFAEVNLQSLEQNFLALKTLTKGAGLAPMVKADAYGHGDVHASKICERLGARYLGVALIEEGIKLRLAGINMPILVFGFFDSIGADAIVKYRLTPVLSTFGQIEKLKSALHENTSYPVHVKFNTGMQRLGFEPEAAEKVAEEFSLESYLKLEGICSHLISGDDVGEKAGHSENQKKIFDEIHKTIKLKVQSPIITHMSNSAGILSGLSSGFAVYRPGLSLYGVLPKREKDYDKVTKDLFSPVFSLRSHIAHLHKVKKSATVSYGATWKAQKDSTIAVIPIGYADGIPRSLSNKGNVLVQGQLCPITGIVCMDYFMVDVTGVKLTPSMGEEVVIIGQQKGVQITATDMAEQAGTIAYEILTGIQPRVPRVYIH